MSNNIIFSPDENSRDILLRELPDMLTSARLTWNKISQKQWSIASFQKLFDLVTEITSKTALHDLSEIHQAALPIKECFDAYLQKDKVPSHEQLHRIEELFEHLDQLKTAIPSPASTNPMTFSRKIYLLHDEDADAQAISQQLAARNYEPVTFNETHQLVDALLNQQPAAILIESGFLTTINPLKGEILRLKAQSDTCIPVIFISHNDDISVRIAAMRAGASRYFSAPHNIEQITNEIIHLATPKTHSQFKVLVIEDDPSQAEFASSILSKAGMDTDIVTHPLLVMEKLKQFHPDIILMDIYMPDANGLELTTIIRDDLQYMTTPIIFLSGETDQDKQIDALLLGGDDFISKPIRPKHLIATVQNRIKRTRDLISAISLQHNVTIVNDEHKLDTTLIVETSETKETTNNAHDSAADNKTQLLEHALKKGSLKNYFQPILEVSGKTEDTYSLIITLQDDTQTFSWDDMQSIAQTDALQESLDQWAVDSSLDAIKNLHNKGINGTLFIPQSVHSIKIQKSSEWIKARLRSKHMAGTHMVLEYNINELASHIKNSQQYFAELRDMGFKVCITGFPAKRAAFKLQQFLKADYVKVASRLLDTDNSVINSFVNQSHKLNTQVIVPNISDPRSVNLHWTTLADFIQGDFISPASDEMNFNFSQAAL